MGIDLFFTGGRKGHRVSLWPQEGTKIHENLYVTFDAFLWQTGLGPGANRAEKG